MGIFKVPERIEKRPINARQRGRARASTLKALFRPDFVRSSCRSEQDLEADVLRGLDAIDVGLPTLEHPNRLLDVAPNEFPAGYQLGAYTILGVIGSGVWAPDIKLLEVTVPSAGS